MDCPDCGFDNPEGLKFCGACGASLGRTCPGCGFHNPPGFKFCGACGTSLVAAAPAEDAEAVPLPSEPEGERRQLTVMFCDMVGSTALSERLDPEDLHEVIGAFQEACRGAVERFEGHVAKYLGDGLLVYFGYPTAHEDDAERAARAGLSLVEAVAKLEPRPGLSLQARVGIATGLVVAGDLAGAGEEQAVVGETPNLAARLQGLAEPDTVVISASTRRLVGGLLRYDDLGSHRLKGISGPVRAWRVTGEQAAETRFEAARAGRLTPFVGREHEIALLIDRWEQAKEGEGQVVLLSGEAGIGKSRITQILRERIASEPHTRLRYQCSPYYTNSALHPVISQLQFAAGFAPDDSPEERLDKLEALLAQSSDPVEEVAPLFASLLSLPCGDRYPPLQMTPRRQKEETLEALTRQLTGLALSQPVLMIFEDAHWMDPTTQESVELTLDRVHGARILVVITFRPEFTLPWGGHTHISSLTLNRLSRRHSRTMLERVAAGKALPEEVRDQIVAKTDGVPLFVEELTKTVLESGLLMEEADRYTLTGPLPPLAIPATLHDSLMARLDRLAPVKEVAQIGAAIGREFSHELLAPLSPIGDNELADALGQLVDSELVFRRGVPPDTTYTFKHALVQDAAYASLLKSRRQQLHARIAKVLEERFPERAEAEPEFLAHHYTQAGLPEQAISHWQRAGQRAAERSASREALAHLNEGLELLKTLPDTPARAKQELALQSALTGPMIATKGYTAPELERTYARTQELSEQIGETPQVFPVLYGRWAFHYAGSQIDRCLELAQDFLRLAERQQDDDARMVGRRMLATSHLVRGEPATALRQLEPTLSLYDPERHRSLAFLYGQDVKVSILSYISLILAQLGYPDQALARGAEMLDQAEEFAHPNTLGYALFHAALLHALCRQGETVREFGERMVTLAAEHEFPVWAAYGRWITGWGLAQQGQAEDGMAAMREGIDATQALPMPLAMPIMSAWLAEACARVGKQEEGVRALDEGDAAMERGGERWFEAESHRVRGALLLARSAQNAAQAEDCFDRARQVARGQQARLLELRAATSLARLWRDQDKRAEARDLLARLYDWFSEGFDTPDLSDAKALLDELS